MKVHLFGAASSPGCANYGLKQLAMDNESEFPLGSQFIMKDFYVDDGVTSVENVSKAIQLAQEARKLCTAGGLRLHKFMCNDKAVLESIPSSERAAEVKALDVAFKDVKLERALGIHWHIESDTFRLCLCLKDQPATRRAGTAQAGTIPFLVNCSRCGNAGKMILQIWRKSPYRAAICLLVLDEW